MLRLFAGLALFFTVSGCSSSVLSPPQLTGDQQADLAVKEYLMATYQLANQYGFAFGYSEDTSLTKKLRQNQNSDLFGAQLRADIPYIMTLTQGWNAQLLPVTADNQKNATIYFIKTGTYASLILCRNYLSGLRDRNEYFEFLQQELNVAGGLATIAMQLSNANGTIRTSVESVLKATNTGFDLYQTYKFLAPEVETILPIVALAQSELRHHYLNKGFPTTFSGAINAVSQIEYQCTRSGIRSLLNKTLTQGQPQFRVVEGVIYAKPVETPKDKPSASK